MKALKVNKLIEIKVYLSVEEGLNRDNVALGYVKNLEDMHTKEYYSKDNKGNPIERVKIVSIRTQHGGNIFQYVNENN